MLDSRIRPVIETVKPQIHRGQYPIKRVTGEKVHVTTEVVADGHDLLKVRLAYRPEDSEAWSVVPMTIGEPLGFDTYHGEFLIEKEVNYIYTVWADIDRFETWKHGFQKKLDAGVQTDTDLAIGADIARKEWVNHTMPDIVKQFAEKPDADLALDVRLSEAMQQCFDMAHAAVYDPPLEVLTERERAAFSSWYEFFPRSVPGKPPGKHGTFQDAKKYLKYVADLGFHIVYFPPVHPIGKVNRKGKNNTLEPGPEDTGSPWAIGSEEGGHTGIHPDLGTLDDFLEVVKEAENLGLEIALDIAFQCAPDHPWVKEHPQWFRHRPDGTIQYAENPPKKYQDIYPIDFETEDWQNLHIALRAVFEYWIDKGVKIFRVDNPHTKAFRFWQWVLADLRSRHRGLVFLSETFSRPRIMQHLAKAGFSQSYTYFTWRNNKAEMEEYVQELISEPAIDFFRPSFWPNTPDILHEAIQEAPLEQFAIRFLMASLLSSSYGMYGPVYELGIGTPVRKGSEEYLNSDKYQFNDWPVPDNWLVGLIQKVNRIRNESEAFQRNRYLKIQKTNNEAIMAFTRCTEEEAYLIVISQDPYNPHYATVEWDPVALGLKSYSFLLTDELSGETHEWHGRSGFVALSPEKLAHIFRIQVR